MTAPTPESPNDKLRRLAAGGQDEAARAKPTLPAAPEPVPAPEPGASEKPTLARPPELVSSPSAPPAVPPGEAGAAGQANPPASATHPRRPEPEPPARPTIATPPAATSTVPPVTVPPKGQPEQTQGWFKPDREAFAANQRDAAHSPRLDRDGMALPPSRQPEVDPYGTRVQPGALRLPDTGPMRRQPPTRAQARRSVPPNPNVVLPSQPSHLPPPAQRRSRRNVGGCIWNVLRLSFFAGLIGGLVGILALGVAYIYIAADLPPHDDLLERASQFETTRVFDGRGNLLYEIVDPQAGRRTRVPLEQISPFLIAATIATEDSEFYQHPGFDPVAIVRAILQNLEAGETVSGASTITQQVVRALVLSPEERAQRTNLRKIREVILAAEITRRYTKDQILELYLNEIYYGNLAYGIEAASETYFSKRARELTLSEGAFLAGLPQSPAVYDIYTDPETTLERARIVLFRMASEGCLGLSIPPHEVCVTADDYGAAWQDLNSRTFIQPANDARFPHWVNFIRQQLEEQYGAQTLYRSGFSVYTTLDPDLQQAAQDQVARQVAALADRHVTNGVLVAMRPTTGEVLVMVGSDDYADPVDGQINMAIRPRQPGSSIKPLTYALAFEKGWTPATLIWDVPTQFPDGANPPYEPVNYDGFFHGPARVRLALANSYNIPAVKALQFTGIFGDGAFIPFARSLGIESLNREDYGLSLTLGGGDVTPLELVTAYSALANGGRRVFPISIARITDSAGNLVCQQWLTPTETPTATPSCQTPPANWGQPVLSAETAYLISHILADNDARTLAFGPNSALLLSFPAAVKTGTTNDFRDNWTVGYTPDLVTGVWVGNADFTPMVNTTGVTGAAPIWHNFMEAALAGRAAPFVRPGGIMERQICAISGTEPSEFCPARASPHRAVRHQPPAAAARARPGAAGLHRPFHQPAPDGRVRPLLPE